MRRENDHESDLLRPGPDIVLRRNDFQSSTKLDALLHDLSAYHITAFPFPLTDNCYRGYSQ